MCFDKMIGRKDIVIDKYDDLTGRLRYTLISLGCKNVHGILNIHDIAINIAHFRYHSIRAIRTVTVNHYNFICVPRKGLSFQSLQYFSQFCFS